jgi:hypothetical protein
MKQLRIALIVSAAFVSTGCATITSNEMQTVSLNTKAANGQPVEKVECSLKNDKGSWQATSPGTVAVHRSAEDLMVECKKEGVPDGFLRAISRAAGGMFGNIIFGGGIGALIDHNKGTGYDYPNDLPIKMGESVTVDKRQEQQVQQAQTDTQATPEPIVQAQKKN